MKELEILESRIERLIKASTGWIAEKKRLEKLLSDQEHTIRSLTARLEAVNQETASRSVAQTVSNMPDMDKSDLKAYLDQVIQSIENNIQLLEHSK